MPAAARTADARPAQGPSTVPTDRRNRGRLRDLCDEVLASFRVARERDLFSDGERSQAQSLLARVAPPIAR